MCITLAIVREIELAIAFWNQLLINGIVNGIFSFGTFHNFRHNMPNNELKARKAFEWLTKVDGRERKLGGDMDRVKDIVMTYRPNKIMSLDELLFAGIIQWCANGEKVIVPKILADPPAEARTLTSSEPGLQVHSCFGASLTAILFRGRGSTGPPCPADWDGGRSPA